MNFLTDNVVVAIVDDVVVGITDNVEVVFVVVASVVEVDEFFIPLGENSTGNRLRDLLLEKK